MTNPTDSEPEEPPLWAELSEGPAAPPPDVTPVAATLAEPASRIPVDRDRWFVEPQNGRRMGPFTWKELLGCVKAKMFFADDLAYTEVNSNRHYLRDLFPTLAIRDPGPPVEPIPTAMQQLVHNPVSTVLFGPQVRPYQRLFDAYYAANARFVAMLAIIYAFVWSGAWIAVFVGFAGQQRELPLIINCVAGVFLSLGLLNFSAALLELEFFFNFYRKIRWWRSLLGDIAVRKYLIILSWVPMEIGLLLILSIVSLAWR